MRVCEWEKGVSQRKYDSPTNLQLFEHLKDNKTYNLLLARSASIMQEKMKTEFDVQRSKAERIKVEINKKYAEMTAISGNLVVLEKKLIRLSEAEDIAETKKHIADMKRAYDKKVSEFDGAITRDLKKICWGFANLYFAYMTLSKNYSTHSDDMYMCTINNYFSLFGTLRSLHDVAGLNEIVLKETSAVINDISIYVDVSFNENNALLSDHPGYSNAIYEGGNYLINLFDAEASAFASEATKIASLETDVEQEFEEFGKAFSDSYFKLLKIAEKYYGVVSGLSEMIQNALQNDFKKDTAEWNEANTRAVEYESRKNTLYKALAAYVIKVFKCVSGVSGINRRSLLIQTTKMLASFRKVVDYRDKSAETVLSDWNRYSEIWSGTNEILSMEMGAKFSYLHQVRLEIIDNAHGNKLGTDILMNMCLQYNAVFQMYSNARLDSFEYECILVNHYVKYLESILRLGAYTHTIISETSNGNWRVCSKYIKKLMQDERIVAEKKGQGVKL